jgi:two-component system cell cycle sensor histidine kinase/response regulator CckA
MTPTNSRPPITLLIAEDNDSVRRLVCTVLSEAGFQMLQARDGLEALNVAELYAGRISLLLSDVRMPRLGGVELAEKIQAKWPRVIVILMSANATDLVITNPGWRFVQKPFLPTELVKIVREMLEGPQTAASAEEQGPL